jgi:hypothetical protein
MSAAEQTSYDAGTGGAPAGAVGRITAMGASSVTVQATAPPGAWAVNVHLPATTRFVRARWEGQSVLPRSEGKWTVATFVPPLLMSQATLGLPAAGAPLQHARAPYATQSQLGDMTVVASRVSPAPPAPVPAPSTRR